MNSKSIRSPNRPGISRRRAIRIMGAAAGMVLMPRMATAKRGPHWQRWNGEVMGAASSIELLGPDATTSRALVSTCLEEARRLEALFSLYNKVSAISRLNARGFLDNPDTDFVRLLQICDYIHSETKGAFDISVQPLWRAYGDHFLAKPDADPKGPDAVLLAKALELVDQNAIELDAHRIWFTKPGMQITLNGIAQGYITDRIAALLRDNGIDRVLVDMGETRALGRNAENAPWQIGLMNPRNPFELAGTMQLENRALATSGAYGFEFDKKGRFHHILDPKTGLSTVRTLSISVTASTAATADGFSTAFSVMERREIERAAARNRDIGALVTNLDGTRSKFGKLPRILF